MRERHTREVQVNFDIKADEVRLVGNDGENRGVFNLEKALDLTEKEDLDLIQVAPEANPPVCKMMDYGKWKYRQQKKEKKRKKNATTIKVKELQFTTRIEEHDIKIKLDRARRFFEDKNKVKLVIVFKGREYKHQDIGYEMINDLMERLS
ncbi:MAG: translation initiation factor IF-3, partial [Clostridiales bacterium]|nr:translation initiation factor IF-3 [Clostridiales bacterium]